MITHVNLITLFVTDQDAAKAFYLDKLGFVEGVDLAVGGGFRWVTIRHPARPELEVVLSVPGPPMDGQIADAIRAALANGTMGGFGLATDDCRGDYERLSAAGVEFIQAPSDQPYGVEAVLRDNSGNWLALVESKPYSAADFAEE